MATTTKLITYEEWLTMPEVQDAIEEVVNGEVRIMPAPKFEHALIVHTLRRALEGELHLRAALFFVDAEPFQSIGEPVCLAGCG